MKNQYFGDQRDYFKYGLLRKLADVGGLKLVVCWMMTGRDRSRHGLQLGYLRKRQIWRPYDPLLFDFLDRSVRDLQRSVALVQLSGVLGSETRFFPRTVPAELEPRAIWLAKLLRLAAGADLIYFDPDNGFEVPSRPIGRKGSSSHLGWAEARHAFASGHSLMVYQHLPRFPRTVEGFAETTAGRIRDATSAGKVIAVRVPSVLFFLVLQPAHAVRVSAGVASFESVWTPGVQVIRFT